MESSLNSTRKATGTVEGLDLHSQTRGREHQHKSMDKDVDRDQAGSKGNLKCKFIQVILQQTSGYICIIYL